MLSGLLFLNQARPASLIRRPQPGGDKKEPSVVFFSDNHMEYREDLTNEISQHG